GCEVGTVIQTGKVDDFPVVLLGVEYWQPLLDFLHTTMVGAGTISAHDVDRLVLTDDPEVAIATIAKVARKRFGLHLRPLRKPSFVLGERRARAGAESVRPKA